MVKLEGGGWTTSMVRTLVERGIPVCAHLGFTPQSVHALGGYRIQGREETSADAIRRHAQELADAGAGMLVLELVPAVLARELTVSLAIPVIGIGAGAGCSGQVLVLHDMLGLTRGNLPRFVRNLPSVGLGWRRPSDSMSPMSGPGAFRTMRCTDIEVLGSCRSFIPPPSCAPCWEARPSDARAHHGQSS